MERKFDLDERLKIIDVAESLPKTQAGNQYSWLNNKKWYCTSITLWRSTGR